MGLGTFPRCSIHPYFSIVQFGYHFAMGQSNAGAFIFVFCMQALKDNKYTFPVFSSIPMPLSATLNCHLSFFDFLHRKQSGD